MLYCIICILIFAGCSGQTAAGKTYGIAPPLKGLYWGMTNKEVQDVLGNEKFTCTHKDYFTQIILEDKQKLFGFDATVQLTIIDEIDKSVYDYLPYDDEALMSARLVYNDINIDTLKKNISKYYKLQGEDRHVGLPFYYTDWKSKDTYADIKEQYVKDGLAEFRGKYEAYLKRKGLDGNDGSSLAKSQNDPINAITLAMNESGGSDCSVVFNAGGATIINKLVEMDSSKK